MLDFPKNIQLRDCAILFNLVIWLNGFTVSSGIIDNRLNGEGIIARPLDVDRHMRIIMIRKKNRLLSRYAKSYIESIEQYMSIK